MIVIRNVMRGEQRHERPRRARPLGRHAVPRQVARHQIQQAGHRRCAGEPEDGDRADVVDRAEQLAEVVVRQVGQRAADASPPSANASGGMSSVVTIELPISSTLMMSAAVRSSFLVFRMRPADLRRSPGRPGPAASPRRRFRTPTARARASERPASDEPSIIHRVAVLREQRIRPARQVFGMRDRSRRCRRR